MFRKFNLASSLVGLYLYAKTVSSSPYEVTVFDSENASMLSEEQPLSIHVKPEILSPEVIEKLGTSSNIIFSDLPNSPQFVSLKDYESMMFATNELLDELLQQNRANDGDGNNNNNDNNSQNQIKEPSNKEDRGDYESIKRIYDDNQHEDDQVQEPPKSEYEEEPSTEEFTTTSTVLETQPETTVTETESSCYECISHSTYSSPCTSTSTFVEPTPSSTSSEEDYSCSHCSSTHTPKKTKHHKTTASTTISNNGTISSVHPTFTSKHYWKPDNSTKIQHPKLNHTNHSSIGFHNASSSIMPTTIFFAFLISILVFAQMC
ncbi:hypothetical protein ZYGR_0AS02710 [Zygosaccharomyces rouxii]|uniref:Uncharacterized protein n=1 Tax=Zygosaccharomyces rouxii TaxID=4956 RepID=A0A1Q3AGX0_ZYGRO|nr:hypothetical protein ZYGR_0AS02710 [Zygosaccharomyces rouxii]